MEIGLGGKPGVATSVWVVEIRHTPFPAKKSIQSVWGSPVRSVGVYDTMLGTVLHTTEGGVRQADGAVDNQHVPAIRGLNI